jgi:hypothetical protein
MFAENDKVLSRVTPRGFFHSERGTPWICPGFVDHDGEALELEVVGRHPS